MARGPACPYACTWNESDRGPTFFMQGTMFNRAPLRTTTLQRSWLWFHRVVAIFGLLSGLVYWARLIGVSDGAQWRFDLMAVHWQVASVTLAVLFPFAASGLWMLASWGAVIWFLCAAIEVGMHAGFPDMFGARPALVAAHVLIALVYCGFRLIFFLQKRQQAD